RAGELPSWPRLADNTRGFRGPPFEAWERRRDEWTIRTIPDRGFTLSVSGGATDGGDGQVLQGIPREAVPGISGLEREGGERPQGEEGSRRQGGGCRARAGRRLDPLSPGELRRHRRHLQGPEHHLRQRDRRVEGVLPRSAGVRD